LTTNTPRHSAQQALPDSIPAEKPRRLQKAWRSLSMRAVLRLLKTGPSSLAEKLSSDKKLRVLYIRHDLKIGDLVMSTGIIRAIAKSSPNITLDVLTSGHAHPVLLGNPHINKLYVYRRKEWWTHPSLWRDLRRARYDIVVDGRVNHISRHATLPLFLLASGCDVRVGAECEHPRLYSHTVKVPPGLHFVEQAATIVSAFGVPVSTTDFHPEIFLSAEEAERASKRWDEALAESQGEFRLLVNISAAAIERRWPDERFIEVLNHVRTHPLKPGMIVISSTRDRESAVRVAKAVGAMPIETPDLRDAIALVATCDLLLTPDTGIAHIASAFSKRTVDLLLDQPVAPGPPMRKDAFVPYKTPGRLIYSPDMLMTSLDTAPVIEAMQEELDDCLKAMSAAAG
jgi:ADP-heptose:LPS heptosyltransferase